MPMTLFEAITANFPDAVPRRDFSLIAGEDGIHKLDGWDVQAMGRARPAKATLERWMSEEGPSAAVKDRRAVAAQLGRKGSIERALFRWMVAQINELRALHNLPPLTKDDALSGIAPGLNADD